jgi:hypothetical protein
MTAVLALLVLACSPPFDETRKDLVGFRLVGMAAEGTTLRALVWSGEGAYHSVAPTVAWTIDGEAVTAAPAAPFTALVRVESAAGEFEEGELVIEEAAVVPVVSGFTREMGDNAATVAVTADGDTTTRWKASRGAFTETGPHAADWTQADLPTEDEPDPAPGDPGPAALIALTLDGHGGTTWTWIDVATDAGPYLAVGGRLLPVDAAVPAEGRYLATLTPADTLAGLVLTDLVPAGDTDTGELVCGLDPFDADALADGRCGLDEAAGARVLLTGAPWP